MIPDGRTVPTGATLCLDDSAALMMLRPLEQPDTLR
jgi:hypothetical protein